MDPAPVGVNDDAGGDFLAAAAAAVGPVERGVGLGLLGADLLGGGRGQEGEAGGEDALHCGGFGVGLWEGMYEESLKEWLCCRRLVGDESEEGKKSR